MLTKHVFALLALGGELRAHRSFPHPYHYTVTRDPLCPHEVTDDDVIRLLQEKRIAAPNAAKMLTSAADDFAYAIIDPVWFKDEALQEYTVGFGRCPTCGGFPLAITSKGVAPRHGHWTGIDGVKHPPCEGTGKPLVNVCSRAPLKAEAA